VIIAKKDGVITLALENKLGITEPAELARE
jgi:hypothetical protein